MTNRAIDARSEKYVEDYAALDPIMATYLGIAGHDDRLPDLSPDGFTAREAATRTAYDEVAALTPVDEREQVAKDAFLERLGLTIETADAGYARSDLSVISSGAHELRECFDLMPTEGEEDWANIDARLAAIPASLAGYRQTLAAEAAAGRVCARRQYAEVADQIAGWTGEHNFFLGLADQGAGASLPAALSQQLDSHARAASAAYAEFGLFLSDELVPQGRADDAVGREHYALASRYFLGATVDLEETYAWGWAELNRIHEDKIATADRVRSGASIAEAVAALDADPARIFTTKDGFMGWMQDLADRTLADLAGTHFDIPEAIHRIECRFAPTGDGGVYYTGPSEDFSRPGRMWFSWPEGMTSMSSWRETTTVFHEGVPGHHLQVGQTAYRAELLNRWQRLMCWVSGHGEGWALYSERLMDELGYLQDPGDRLGFLDMQGFRAARVVVDIGVHLGLTIPADNPFGFHPGETWHADLVFEFMREHSLMDDSMLRFEVLRYLGWPGQAPSYKVGERIWLEARASAQARAGTEFDLKSFHRAALDLGSLGLDPLQAALARL